MSTNPHEEPVDWAAWYDAVLDALVEAITGAGVDWATDPDGNPYVIEGQTRPSGVGHPHAMILEFRKTEPQGSSTRAAELRGIETSFSIFDEGDAQAPEENLRRTLRQMGTVENAIYANRSLDQTCREVTVTEADAFELEADSGRETVANVSLEILKTAEHPH